METSRLGSSGDRLKLNFDRAVKAISDIIGVKSSDVVDTFHRLEDALVFRRIRHFLVDHFDFLLCCRVHFSGVYGVFRAENRFGRVDRTLFEEL